MPLRNCQHGEGSTCETDGCTDNLQVTPNLRKKIIDFHVHKDSYWAIFSDRLIQSPVSYKILLQDALILSFHSCPGFMTRILV